MKKSKLLFFVVTIPLSFFVLLAVWSFAVSYEPIREMNKNSTQIKRFVSEPSYEIDPSQSPTSRMEVESLDCRRVLVVHVNRNDYCLVYSLSGIRADATLVKIGDIDVYVRSGSKVESEPLASKLCNEHMPVKVTIVSK